MNDTPIRDAATMILVRNAGDRPAVLLGQRGAGAAFMPSKFVFPGGAVDRGDADIALSRPLDPDTRRQLATRNEGPSPEAIAVAAIRELWEESGLILGERGPWHGAPPQDWQGYAATGHVPSATALRFVFRALTPPGQTRRFDARFFLAEAEALAGDPDDFSAASDELANLQWVPLDVARGYNLPFITELVLAEVSARLKGQAPVGVPFVLNHPHGAEVLRL